MCVLGKGVVGLASSLFTKQSSEPAQTLATHIQKSRDREYTPALEKHMQNIFITSHANANKHMTECVFPTGSHLCFGKLNI